MLGVNFVAVLVATVVNFIIGALWHGPVFGKTWMRLQGFTPESVKSMKLKPMQAMILGFISTLVMAFVLALLVGSNLNTAAEALLLAFLLWLGFIVTTLAGSVLWEGRSVKLFLFNIAYQFVALAATALVLAFWK